MDFKKKMKSISYRYKLFFIALSNITAILLSTNVCNSQNNQIGSSCFFNSMSYNPASAGQYQHSKFALGGYLHSPSFPGSQKNVTATASAPKGKHIGLGGAISNNHYGVTSKTGINGSYAYKLFIRNRNSNIDRYFNPAVLSFGLSAGLNLYQENLIKLDVQDNDPKFQENVSEIMPVFGLGMLYTDNCFTIGFAVPNLIEISKGEGAINSLPNFYLNSGYIFKFTDNWSLNPQILVDYVAGSPFQLNLLATVNYQSRFDFGLGVTSFKGILATTAIKLTDDLQFLLFYDYVLRTSTRRYSGIVGWQLSYNLGSGKHTYY